MNLILFSFLFFLPAGIANMVPVIVAKIPLLEKWNYPLDFYKKFNGKRILGDHKTIRGLVFGVILGTLTAVFLSNNIALGFLLSFGALAGDSVKSFLKRQINISSGKSWFPFDQIDYILGGLALSLFVVRLSVVKYIAILATYFLLHLFISFLGFLFHLKKSPI